MKIPLKLHNYLFKWYNFAGVYDKNFIKNLETHDLIFDENLSKHGNYYNYNPTYLTDDKDPIEYEYYFCKKCLNTVYELIWPKNNKNSWNILTCNEIIIKNLLE